MFNRFLNKISDGAKASPSRNVSLNGDEMPSPEEFETPMAAEGFLCPACMAGFPSPESLQDHYETSHSGGNDVGLEKGLAGAHICSACKMKLGSAVELESHYTRHHMAPSKSRETESPDSLRQELDELHTSLKEERWYSDELKKEVSRLQSSVEFVRSDGEHKTDTETFYQNQIRILEESKSLALAEAVLLKEHLNDSRNELMRVRNDKDKLEQKAATMAGDIANLKSQLDETTGEKTEFVRQLKEAQNKIADLQAEVGQRLGSEDALLLRQELVTVQNLMDQLTLEKEEEKNNLQKICDKLELEKERLEAALQEAPDKAEIERLRSSLEALSESSNAKIEESINNCTEAENKLQNLEAELTISKQKVGQAEQQIREINDALQVSEQSRLEIIHDNEKNVAELRRNAQEMEQEKLKELLGARSETEKLNLLLQDKEGEVKELMDRINQSDSKLHKKENLAQELGAKLTRSSSELEKTVKLIAEEKERATKLETEIIKLKDSIERFETERTELYEKIESGDGAKTAIQQLQQENTSLQAMLTTHQETNQTAQQKAHKALEELNNTLKQETDKRETTEKEILLLQTKLAEDQFQIKELAKKIAEVKDKSAFRENEFSELKDKSASEKLKFEHQLATFKAQIQDSDGKIKIISSSLEEVTQKLSAEQSKYSELKTVFEKCQEDCKKWSNTASTQDSKLKSMQTDMTSLQTQLSETKKHSFEVGNKVTEKEKFIKKQKTELADVGKTLDTKIGQISLLEKEINTLKSTLSINDIKISDLQSQLEEGSSEIAKFGKLRSELEPRLLETEQKAKEWEERAIELKNKVAELNQELKNRDSSEERLKENESKLTQELEAKKLTENELRDELEISKVTNLSLESRIFELDQGGNDMNAKIGILNLKIVETSEELKIAKNSEERLNTECLQLEDKLNQTKAKMNQEREKLSAAEEGKQILIEQKLKIQSELEDAIFQLQDIKSTHTVFKAECQQNEKLLEAKVENLTEQLEEGKNSLKYAQQQWEDSRSQLEAKSSVLTENLTTIQQDLAVEKHRSTTLETKVDELGGAKLDLEAKLENALDERRALLDRCLRSEDEGEKLRTTTSDLRRKVDDTLAALHELGRENQSLQIENMKLVQRKWAEDNEVTHCTACRKQFTVTVRKHHCRSCGSIFCNECSSKSATIASYKKAVRVCDSCHDEVGQ